MAEYESSSDSPNDPQLCANNCGFFGNPATRNFCSLCYNNFLKQNLISTSLKTEQHLNRNQVSESESAADRCCTGSESEAPARKNRCKMCNKKIGLLGFGCRCGGSFCKNHRFQDKHDCSFDLRTIERQKLATDIVQIKGDKLENRL